jgi:hypothetical protein
MNLSYAAAVTTPVPRSEYSESETDNIDLTSEEPSMLTGFTNALKLLELEKSIKYIDLDVSSLNTAQSIISGEMKQVVQATVLQSKEINAMKSEMGNIYYMLKELHIHIMPYSHPLPPQPNYAEIRASNEKNYTLSPSNIPPPRKKQNTGEEENLQFPYLTVPGLNEPSSKSGLRASSED